MDTPRCFQYAEFKGLCGVHIRIHGDCVGGGILTHGVPAVHHLIEGLAQRSAGFIGGASVIMPTLLNAVAGIIAGAVVLLAVSLIGKGWRALRG